MDLEGLSKSYGRMRVFEHVSLRIERGGRIALVGVNGRGRSTLIRMLAGTEPLTAEVRRQGYRVGFDQFSQDQYRELDEQALLLDDLGTRAPVMDEADLHGFLGCFLFCGDDVFTRRKAQTYRTL